MNVPWEEADMGDADYLYAFQKIIMPIAYEFAPDFVISEHISHQKPAMALGYSPRVSRM